MLNLEILFCSWAVISKQETSGSGTLLAVVLSIAVAAYGEEINRTKGCNACGIATRQIARCAVLFGL